MNERKVLVADDDPDIVELIDETLSANNFTVLKTDNGYSVISKARSEHPDLIILDLMLPRLDGYQTCKRLKEFADTKNIPVLIISGHTSKEMVLKLLALGIKNYLAKPFDINELVKRVNLLYQTSETKNKKETKLRINFNLSDNILTVILSGDFERTDVSLLAEEIEARLSENIKKVIINIANLKSFGIEQVNYLKEINEYFSQKEIKIKISAGDTRNLRANLIRNSELRDLLVAY